MDKEQDELKLFGFFEIWSESFKMIHKWSEIFLRIALALILPLSFIYLSHTEINHLASQNMSLTLTTLGATSTDKAAYEKLSQVYLRELTGYMFIQIAYIVVLFVFSLLSTSAVVYTVACIYSAKKVSFKDVKRVIIKVWKRLLVTFICVMAVIFLYNFLFFFVITIILILAYPFNSENIGKLMVLGLIVLVIYSVGLSYMSVVWQLANTISVLEQSYGFRALKKSKILMKGKMGTSFAIYLTSGVLVGVVVYLYHLYVVMDIGNIGMVNRVGLGLITLFVLSILLLLVLVVKTVLYLVCKSYHHEEIDKTALADHLEVYQGEGYVLLKPKDIQLMEEV